MPQYISPDIIRICKVCGKSFHPSARKQFCCNEKRVVHCEICGKPFEITCNTSEHKSTCNKSCANILIKRNRELSASKLVKKCKWCGKPFIPTSVRDVYCKDVHYQTCEVCGKQFEIDVRKDDSVRTCSKECRYILANTHRDNDHMVKSLKHTCMLNMVLTIL